MTKISFTSLVLLTLIPLTSASSPEFFATNTSNGNSAQMEKDLKDAFNVIARDYPFRRREWHYQSIKYEGFLQYFGRWRLVLRLGGRYTASDGAVYYNKWNWEEGLDTLTNFLEEMEKYHRIYRLFVGKRSERMQREWNRRYPHYETQRVQFMKGLSRYPAVELADGRTIDGYIASNDVEEIRNWQKVRDCGHQPNSSFEDSMMGSLLDKAYTLVKSCRQLMQPVIPEGIALANLTEIIQNYVNFSTLAWDDMSDESWKSVGFCPRLSPNTTEPRLNQVSSLIRRLSRQLLGHLLLLMKHLSNEPVDEAVKDLFCRVMQEDIDPTLEVHLEKGELQELKALIATCIQLKNVPGESLYRVFSDQWKIMRDSISKEYSAFKQYSNRIPAILTAKLTVKTMLPIITAIGLIFNVLVIWYYAKQCGSIGRHLLLVILAASDILILFVSIAVLYTDHYMEHDRELRPDGGVDAWCKFHAYLLNMTVEAAAYMLVVLSFERCVSVLSISSDNKSISYRKLAIISLSVICFTCIFNCMLIIGDELAAPARSTVGHQCVHYVRLANFESNLVYATRVKPIINTIARSVLPYTLVALFNIVTCWHLFKKGTYFSLYRQEEETQPNQLSSSLSQLFLALAYLVLTAPAPIIYALFMSAHGDRLQIKLSNGLYDEVDPMFRNHWRRIGQLTVAQYVTEYVLIPISASINFFVFVSIDRHFKNFLLNRANIKTATHQEECVAVVNSQQSYPLSETVIS